MKSNNYRVAIIEDDRDVQFMYQMKLEYEGFKVATANDGQEGLVVIDSFRPDLILLDLMMPVMDGPQMLARLRAEDWASSMRVIVLTNISKDEAPQALRFLRVDRYAVKAHHTPAQLAEMVREVLGIRPK